MIYFFLHIPKTTGTSMRKILQEQYKPDELVIIDPTNPYDLPRAKQQMAEALAAKPSD